MGNGASVCALQDGKSIDVSMGLTPLEGLVMGTRSGDVDPGILLYLMRTGKCSPQDIDDMLNAKSGLLGLSGRSGDVRDLEKAALAGDAHSELALEIFCYRAAKYIGAYAAALSGVDAIAFSGGIGEHSADIRKRICSRLEYLGVSFSEQYNNTPPNGFPLRITKEESKCPAWVIPTDEELQIARDVYTLVSSK
jgi:acetate kinase